MIRAQHAVARYDGLDGYDDHPRQDYYRSISTEVSVECWDESPAEFDLLPDTDLPSRDGDDGDIINVDRHGINIDWFDF